MVSQSASDPGKRNPWSLTGSWLNHEQTTLGLKAKGQPNNMIQNLEFDHQRLVELS